MFEIHPAKSGGYFWRLKGGNGEILCHSEVYNSKQGALTGISAIKRVASSAGVRDFTKQ
jgi:uncharacterized protein YegP (UPF0339 family)